MTSAVTPWINRLSCDPCLREGRLTGVATETAFGQPPLCEIHIRYMARRAEHEYDRVYGQLGDAAKAVDLTLEHLASGHDTHLVPYLSCPFCIHD